MVDPVEIQQIALAAIAGGAIVLFGASYSVFLALSRLRGDLLFARIALFSYACLVLSTLALMVVLNLTGMWYLLVFLLLLGYYIAPRFIWKLSTAIHSDEETENVNKPQEIVL